MAYPLTGTDRGRGGLRVSTIDLTPDVYGVNYIRVSNGTLTDDGQGEVTITTGGGGGAPIEPANDDAKDKQQPSDKSVCLIRMGPSSGNKLKEPIQLIEEIQPLSSHAFNLPSPASGKGQN